MENHIIIQAYGLTTRSWKYEKGRYSCSECCNGDRCDEDCIARYKGRRKDCPHCKGTGAIPEEDAKELTLRQFIDLYVGLERKVEFYRGETSKIRDYVFDDKNKTGHPTQSIFEAIVDKFKEKDDDLQAQYEKGFREGYSQHQAESI